MPIHLPHYLHILTVLGYTTGINLCTDQFLLNHYNCSKQHLLPINSDMAFIYLFYLCENGVMFFDTKQTGYLFIRIKIKIPIEVSFVQMVPYTAKETLLLQHSLPALIALFNFSLIKGQ